ncbi:hypothetical protein BDY24DRAFT_401490 [Mrakia frigida]|uniref:GATA-type transcription factor n=1 Tax=Mrakia frigida TaxID=29902 RepID=UPI003FCC0D56
MPVQKRKLAPGNCAHCGIDETQTSLWRTGSNKEKLCNACGLYVQTHGRMRPLSVLGSRKKADSKKGGGGGGAAAASDEPKEGPSRPKESKSSRHRSGSSSISSSVGSLAGNGTATTSSSTTALPTPHALSLQTRPSRSASISTSSTSLPSPTFSAQDGFPSPQFQPVGADSPPPSMSASLGKLDDVTMGGGSRPGTSVGTDELGAYVRARKGQKRHSISGGSSLGYPHQHTNPNHAVTKAPAANKKKARFELQQQHHHQQQPQRPLTVNTSSASYLASLSSSAPSTSSPISIPTIMLSSRPPSTVCLPCSKCAVLLPLRSSSVPLSEDPVCDRCLDAPGHGFPHQRALTSSSVPARSSAHLMMTSSLAQPPLSFSTSNRLTGWESEDEDYEFVDPPSQQQLQVQMQRQPSWSKRAEQHQQQQQNQQQQYSGTGSHTWSLEEEFSFLDTSFAIDSDPMLDTMEDVPPLPTLAGWGGPFFKNMPMPTGRKFHASAVQESSFSSPMLGGGPAAAAPHQPHRSFASPTSSSSSSTSSLSSFSPVSGLPSPLTSSFNHHQDPSNGLGLPTPSASESNFNLGHSSSSSSSKGLLLGLANLQPSLSRQQALPPPPPNSLGFSSPHQAFAAAAQARLPVRPFLNGSLAEKAMNDGLEYLVNGPLSPIFPGGGLVAAATTSGVGGGGMAMKRNGSARSAGSSFRWESTGAGAGGGGEGEPMQVEMEEGLVSA